MSESKESKVAVYCGECGRDDLPDEAMAQALRRAIENEDRLTAEVERWKQLHDDLANRHSETKHQLTTLTAALAAMTRERDFSRKEEAEAEADNVRLEQELAKMKEQRDRLLRGCKLGLDHLLEANDGWYRDKPTVKYMQDAIAACEQGGSNDK